MLVNEKVGFHRSSDNFESKQFSIKASAKAFSILSSSLYQNKIRAIIRELSCNAIDAQKAANSKKNFQITIPDQQTPLFKIRDFGTGISPDDINKIYTTYFESTKTTSNDMIGCLGLGSKTPFCYTDNFAVCSYYNGKKYTYAATISSEGMPTIHLVMTEDTLEENGLEVSFAVKQTDISTFISELSFVNFWLDVKPTLVKATDFSAYRLVNDNTKIELASLSYFESNIEGATVKGYRGNNSYYGNSYVDRRICGKSYVIMGNVPYQLELDNLPNLSPSERKLSTDGFIHIFVPIGTVEPQASRESLSYTKATISYLEKVISSFLKKCVTLFEEEIDGCDSFYEANKKAFAKVMEFPYSLFAGKDIKYKDKFVNTANSLKAMCGAADFEKVFRRQFYRRGNTGISSGSEKSSYITFLFKENVFFIKKSSVDAYTGKRNSGYDAGISSLKNWFVNNNTKLSEKTAIVLDDSAIQTLELEKIYIDGNTPFVYKLSELPQGTPTLRAQGAKAKGTNPGKRKDQAWEITGIESDGSCKPIHRKIVEIDLEDEDKDYAVLAFENSKLSPIDGATSYYLYKVFAFLNIHGIPIYGLTKRQLEQVQDKDNFISAEVKALDIVNEKIFSNASQIEKNTCQKKVHERFSYSARDLLFSSIPVYKRRMFEIEQCKSLISQLPVDHEIVKFSEKINSNLKQTGTTVELDTIKNIISYTVFPKDFEVIVNRIKNKISDIELNAELESHALYNEVTLEQKELIKKYPMLNLFISEDENLKNKLVEMLAKSFV